jgi:hypothetical protein
VILVWVAARLHLDGANLAAAGLALVAESFAQDVERGVREPSVDRVMLVLGVCRHRVLRGRSRPSSVAATGCTALPNVLPASAASNLYFLRRRLCPAPCGSTLEMRGRLAAEGRACR